MRHAIDSEGKPRITILDPSIAVTGAFRSAATTARLIAPWAEVILVLPSNSRISGDDLLPFARVVRLPMYRIRKSLRDLLLYLPTLLWSGWRLSRLMRQEGCRHLIINEYFLLHGAVARLAGYRDTIATYVRSDPARMPGKLASLWLKVNFLISERVFANSDYVALRLPRSEKVRRLYPPLSIGAEPKATQERNQISYIANYTRGKGHEHAIRVFARIASRFPKASLHFYGGDMGRAKNRGYRAELEALAAASGAGAQVVFHDFVERVDEVLASTCVALNLSENEGFSRTCLEASCAGVPVVASRCGGPEEIVVSGETGYLVPRGDSSEASEALAALLSDPEKAQGMGAAGARHVRTTFSPDRFARAFLEALDLLALPCWPTGGDTRMQSRGSRSRR